jgi:hypothetical protein
VYVFQDSNLPACAGFTSEVSLTYGIFHYVLKKGKKQLMIVIIFRPLQLLAGRDLNPQLSRF